MKLRLDRWWNFLSAFLLLAAFMMTALKIQSTNWTEDLYLLNWLTFIGFVLGLGIGYSQFGKSVSSIFIFLYSILIIPYAIGTTYDSGISWILRMQSLYGRAYFSLEQLVNNVQLEDSILFFIFLCLLVWFTAISGGFLLTRTSKPWTPLLVSGLTIFTSEFYDQSGNSLYTAFFLFFILIFLSQNNFFISNRNWKTKGIPVEFETETLIRRSALVIAFIIIFLAWNAPNIVSSFQKGSQQHKQMIGFIEGIQNQFSKITAPLQGTAYLQSEFYGKSVNLGTGSKLTDEIVLEISVNEKKPSGSRYYLRARSYDKFVDDQWVSSFDSFKTIGTDTEIDNLLEYFLFPQRTFTIQTKTNLGLLYTPPYTHKMNRPVKAYYQPLTEDKVDFIAFTLENIAYSGEKYEVVSRIPNPTISQMRNSSTEYPDLISDYYLQLPPDFSERIRVLAHDITKMATNPYDKSQAITNYLRKNINYSEQISEPPPDTNLIEWFLFDYQEGFCNYYATAEVLMLRSIGIPARMVFGYAEGESQNLDETEYIVRRKQSHAWPEVFFAGIGWVEFEPTTLQPILVRLAGDTVRADTVPPSVRDPSRKDLPLMDGGESFGVGGNIPDIKEPEKEINVEPEESRNFSFLFFAVIILVLIVLLIAIKKPTTNPPTVVVIETFLLKRGWKIPDWLKIWSNYAKSSMEEKAFARVLWSLAIFKNINYKSFTPAEVVTEFKIVFPEMSQEVEEILDEYQKALYSQHPINEKNLKAQSNQVLKHSIMLKLKNIFLLRS